MTPTTTPAAMPATLGLLDSPLSDVGLLEEVTTTVSPPMVTTDGLAEVVAEGLESADDEVELESLALGRLFVVPVS